MINCEEFVMVDGQVVRQLSRKFDVVPQKMLPLSIFQEYEQCLNADKRLFKSYSSLKELYEASIEMGFKILPDSFGGFGFFNHTGKTSKPSLEPLRPFPVGPNESVPQELQNEMSDLSVMRGELERDELVLLGPIRFANHCCSPSTKFFMGYTSSFLPHNRCLFLQAIKSIEVGEEITVSYGNNYFKDGRLKCRCPNKEKHESSNEILQPTTAREPRLGDLSTQSLHASGNSSEIRHSGGNVIQITERVNRVLVRLPILEVPRKENSRINGKSALKEGWWTVQVDTFEHTYTRSNLYALQKLELRIIVPMRVRQFLLMTQKRIQLVKLPL